MPSIQEEIVIQARKAGINPQVALAISECESGYNPNAKNPNSSARGIYQFLSGTWKNYCEGSVLNATDNIKCFMKWYKIYPNWWLECI
ncbi:MAG: transglycosylase SLT domain-containing protein [Candidatus Gastranaerophilaceae bacterium]